ncbi:MAG TPA: sulfatase [Gemmatimonadaceae bacterium]|nr:sulfatase [Gemmatimonadaceae bacterium]
MTATATPSHASSRAEFRPVVFAVEVALAAALAENSARLLNSLLERRPLNYSHHIWWTTPLTETLLFSAVVVLLLIVGRAAPMLRRPRVLLGAALFLGWLTPLLLMPRLATWAKLILAVGLAWSTSEALSRRLGRVGRLQRRLAAPLLIVTVLVAGGVQLSVARSTRAGLGPAGRARADAPNVLVLLWDTVRESSLSVAAGGPHSTPHLEEFARQGVVFERAMATAPFTLPSHASLFTGRWAHELPTTWRAPLDGGTPTLAQAFHAAGYRTGAFSANRYYVTREYGLARGFELFDQHALGSRQMVRSSTLLRILLTSDPVRRVLRFDDDLGRATAGDSHRALLRWLSRPDERPYFAFVNFMEAHAPYLPPPPFDTAFGWYSDTTSASERWRLRGLARIDSENLPVHEALRLQRAYEGAIASLDAAVDALLRDLSGRGLLQNTIVVITSDHGEEFGENGVFSHGNSLYLQALHVPMVIVWPERVPAGRRVNSVVSIRDLPATLTALAAIPSALPGRSLTAYWTSADSSAAEAREVYAELVYDPGLPQVGPVTRGHMMALANDSMLVIRNGDGSVDAFDLREDPLGAARAALDSVATAAFLSRIPLSRR